MPHQPTLFASGFVVDRPDEGTSFPSAGGNSGDPRVQAVYWRCLVVLFASARFTNPDQRLALFTNSVPPVIDGVDIGAVLATYGVELHRVELQARLAPGKTGAWGNVLYFHDIMEYLARTEDPALRVTIVDSDVVVTGPLAPLFALLDDHDFAGYVVPETRPGENVNGVTMEEIDRLARALGAPDGAPAAHFGGELFVASGAAWQRHRALFSGMVHDAVTDTGAASAIITEEHVISTAFAVLGGRIARANHLLKRIWTSPRYSSVAPGDENLALWHLPAEKRYGIRDLYARLATKGFPRVMDGSTFHAMAMKLCGIPSKTMGKILHDGVRQLAAKLGFYK